MLSRPVRTVFGCVLGCKLVRVHLVEIVLLDGLADDNITEEYLAVPAMRNTCSPAHSYEKREFLAGIARPHTGGSARRGRLAYVRQESQPHVAIAYRASRVIVSVPSRLPAPSQNVSKMYAIVSYSSCSAQVMASSMSLRN